MRNTLLKTWLAVTILVAATDCARKSTSGAASPEGANSANAQQQQMGTGDGGGGNTCNGKPLESYIVKDLASLPGYKNLVQPWLASLPESTLRDILTYSFRSKSWLVLPCEMMKLSEARIGAAVKTEQAAVQTFKEVWIAQKIIEQMGEREQAELFVHENLMAIKLLRFDSEFGQCMSHAPKPSYCEGDDDKALGKPSDLTPEDYAEVRKVTAALMDFIMRKQTPSESDLQHLLSINNFSFSRYRFQKHGDTSALSAEELILRLKRIKTTGHLPTLGFQNATIQDACRVDYKMDEKKKVLSLSIQRTSGSIAGVFRIADTKETYWESGKITGRRVQLEAAQPLTAKVGAKQIATLALIFDDNQMLGLNVTEAVCTELSPDKKACWGMSSASEGLDYSCIMDRIPAINPNHVN